MNSINQRPVRVIRGYFKDKKDRQYDSPYAPPEGCVAFIHASSICLLPAKVIATMDYTWLTGPT